MQCGEPSIAHQWGPEEEEEEILSILWAEEEALACQEEEVQEALEDLEEQYLPRSSSLKPLFDLPLMSDLWECPLKFLQAIERKLTSSSTNSNDMFESTMTYQDSNPQ